MNAKFWLSALSAGIGIAVVATLLLRLADAQESRATRPHKPWPTSAPAGLLRPVAPHEMLMEWHERTFNDLNLAIARQKENAPEFAWLLAELANINTLHSDQPDYQAWAAQLRETAVELAAVGKQKDFEQAKALSKKIRATCKACHDVYREDEDEHEHEDKDPAGHE